MATLNTLKKQKFFLAVHSARETTRRLLARRRASATLSFPRTAPQKLYYPPKKFPFFVDLTNTDRKSLPTLLLSAGQHEKEIPPQHRLGRATTSSIYQKCIFSNTQDTAPRKRLFFGSNTQIWYRAILKLKK